MEKVLDRVIHRPTQTADYWSALTITADDADFLYGFILEAGKPQRLADLARALIGYRVNQENAALRRQWSDHTVYQPKKRYAVGDRLVFPALKFASGQVVEVRPGNNPDLGEFEVIAVQFDDGRRREFAANYHRSHRLNDEDATAQFDTASLQSPEALYEAYGQHVVAVLEKALESNREFIRIGDEWFLRALMTEVNIGHLNLAEAVLDMANGGPLTTDVILRDLGLPPDVGTHVQEVSLNNALAADPRFDEVSLNDTPAWFLRRLEPAEAREMPEVLRAERPSGRVALSPELVALAYELDDELEFDETAPVSPAQSATLILTYPHRRAGTLGWSRAAASVLPQSRKPRIPMRFKDRVTQKEMTVWLVREGRYIWGLGDWFKANDLPAGAYIQLTRSDAENIVWIDYRRRRPKREWVHVASARDGRLCLETAQRAVACEVDELMSVFVDDPRALDALRAERRRDTMQAVREAFPEIAKLSPQGNVHARTLYAVVNTITRSAPTDVFAALTASGAYVSVGDNYWHLGER
ncbi:hypothetical protein [Candidatus Roseilinea sp. NK_OTU-006]|nr:hypothetical protein [Candidatus Roseilinea sp. NK_OTU-006]